MSPLDLPKLWTTSSNISKFWFSKSFFSVENWANLSSFFLFGEYWTKRPILIFEILYFLKMCPIFVGSVINFGRSEGDITYLVKKGLFLLKWIHYTRFAQKCCTVMLEPGGQWGHWPPQYLADQFTLFQPGRADHPHLLLLAPPKFFTFWHHCCIARK